MISNYFGTAAVFDVATGERLVNLIENAGPLSFADYSPNGEMIVVAGNGHARILDAKTGRQLHAPEVAEDNEIRGAIFSPDNQHLATAGNKGTQVWEVETGRLLYTWPNASVDHHSYDSLAYSSDGHRLAIGQNDGDTTVWDAVNFEHILTLSGHKLAICSVEFSADGKRILTASHDKTARLWDAETARELLALKGHERPVTTATFFPDGQSILTAGWHEDRVLIWEAATPEQVARWNGPG